MLPHLIPYLLLTVIHLFSGVNAATIGTFPEFNGNNLGSTKNVVKRDPEPEPGRDSKYDFDIDDDGDVDEYDLKQLSPQELEEAFRLMSEIPDNVLEQGSDATEKWLKKHKGHSKAITARWWGDVWSVTKCAGAIAYFIVENYAVIAKLGKLRKLKKLKETIDEVGGYKNAAKLLLSRGKGSRKKKNYYKKLQKLAAEIIGLAIIDSYCT
ncbi:uncharacterized protein BDCG_03055 [Blastomyces dermatitidis ER-3]|uniref:Uncharacterized protein n=1 Tax=Ajellomyces dermatitidis (strain ER-3 / ATCC MYA-2586) TaxID=559297 RepID=A0ABP2EZ37_AJEDR|nr:uncharacterized protein BDCG_03055 [Blastomyces dermatitidis ER-3]EEQ87935.1 hypothetical protein BDCG_03055 [Blastomyces dermatitidis ER-3]EQL33075.1 hypothetical protein BDFG_04822 [Blastomyces dermatitidis ATCC 26199]